MLSLAILGLLLGGGYSIMRPPHLTSRALVVLPPSVRGITTQVVIAGSDPVLARAALHLRPRVPSLVLGSRVRVSTVTTNIIAITASGRTASQAQSAANAVASSYLAYVNSFNNPVHARLWEPAGPGTRNSLVMSTLLTSGAGTVAGAVIGFVGIALLKRKDRRLRTRDQIARAAGAPVLASIQVGHPVDIAGWTRLLETYEPAGIEAFRLQSTLSQLCGATGTPGSLAVISLPADEAALAVGPQIAGFAASLGLRTELVVGPQSDDEPATMFRSAAAMLSGGPDESGYLRVALNILDNDEDAPLAMAPNLTVLVATANGSQRGLASLMRTAATVIGISAGAVEAGQLAEVIAAVSASGRSIAGVLVADPDPTDRTTGRLRSAAGSPERPNRRDHLNWPGYPLASFQW